MTATSNHFDVLIVGGGVIGLSLAWELAQNEARVCVVERGPLGKEASWAGAGMVPPGPEQDYWHAATPLEQLEGLSQILHAQWHEKLLSETGIDNEYQRSGSLQLAFSADEASGLYEKMKHWQTLGIACHQPSTEAIADLEPALAVNADQFAAVAYLPGEAQIRNPRHLRALAKACEAAGVQIRTDSEVHGFKTNSSRVDGVVTTDATLAADQICIAGGSWSGQIASQLGVELPVQPVRGQIALLQGEANFLRRILCVGPRYLVPRRDGRILIGSTQEDVGFDKSNTQGGIDGLRKFAESLIPDLRDFTLETSWAGLRPATPNGQPILGRLPEFDNAWIATGHFRAGLQLSPATAVVMRALILGQQTPIDVSAHSPSSRA